MAGVSSLSGSNKGMCAGMVMRFKTKTLLSLFIALTGAEAMAQEQPGIAVGGEVFAGQVDGETAVSGYAAATFPIAGFGGVHVEGLADDLDGESTRGAGGHAYWRNPDKGLLGVIGATSQVDLPAFGGFPALEDQDVNLYGVEGELYLETVTLAVQVGHLTSDLEELDDEDYLAAELHWYPDNIWYLYGGAQQFADDEYYYMEVNHAFNVTPHRFNVYGGFNAGDFDLGYLGVEYSPTTGGSAQWSLFAELQSGEDDYDAFLIGARMGIGPFDEAPLIPLLSTLSGGIR